MAYVDGFVLPVPKKNLAAYRSLSRRAGKIWRELGALEYRECAGDDLGAKRNAGFPGALRIRRDETVVFAWIVYRSRQHRDQVNAKVMKDPRIARMAKQQAMPFDVTKMLYGGFEVIVDV